MSDGGGMGVFGAPLCGPALAISAGVTVGEGDSVQVRLFFLCVRVCRMV